MNQEQLELIQRILASQNKQLQVDAVKNVQEKNVSNKEKSIEIEKKYLILKNKNEFPIQEQKSREEKRKYTQTFKKALEEEQKQRKEERERRYREEEWKKEIENRRKERIKYTQTFRETLQKEIEEIKEKKRQEEERKKAEIIRRQKQFNKVRKAYGKQEIVLEPSELSFIEKIQMLYKKWKNAQEQQNQILSRQEQRHRDFMMRLQLQNGTVDDSKKDSYISQQAKDSSISKIEIQQDKLNKEERE